MRTLFVILALSAGLAGCKTSYTWTSAVPVDMRTVAVPNFRNESNVTELGAVTASQLLRELQREGTFKIRRPGDAAIEIQGTIKKMGNESVRYNRRTYSRAQAGTKAMLAEISVIDKRNGRVLIDNRAYSAETPYATNQDEMTAERDASRRLADDLARQVVDDLLAYRW